MLRPTYLSIGTGIAAVGAAMVLATQYGSLTANPAHSTVREFHPAAFNFSEIYPWVVGPAASPSSSGAASLSAAGDSAGVAAAGALQAVNQLGPLAFGLDSIRAFSANQAPPGSNAATANYTNMDQWVTGIAGLASSTGALGFTDNATAYDPFVGTHAGVLQTANQLGPFVFDLNVLKAIGLTQAPSGTVLASGQPDNFSAVDIGRWTAGIPGVITNTGTTGFVTYQDFGAGPIADYRVGGLHTTTQIGSTTFDFNVLPAISTGIIPPGISFSMAPDMTAANTPFAASTPPPPGVVQPNGGLPAPAAASAPTAGDPALAGPVEEIPIQTTRINDTKPLVVIPGVNGAPLAKTPTSGTTGATGSDPFDPWKPLKPITDVIGAVNGTKPTTEGPSAGDTGGPSAGGGEGSGTG